MRKNKNLVILLLVLTSFFQLPDLRSQNSSISGIVSEEISGEIVIGATISLYSDKSEKIKKSIRGTYTNKFGFYSLPDVNPGKYKIIVSSVGYGVYDKEIELTKSEDLYLNIKLSQVDVKMQDVLIETNRETNPAREISIINVPIDFLAKMPSIGGEKDIFRSLQLLPGVKQSTELSSGLYIRGGSPDQNLILLDGVVVYNPNHLGGFLSTFNSDAVSDVRLIKGSFPAEYGGRISSVIDLTMKEGTKEKFTGAGGISLINSRLTLQGPINENATFMISGRRMYLDLIFKLFPEDENLPNYYFYDLNAKFNYKISESDRIFLSGFTGKDIFSTSENDQASVDVNWGNSTGNLRWMHIVSPNLFTNFSLIYSDYNFKTSFFEQDNIITGFSSISKIQDWTFRAESQYFPLSDHTIKTGLESIWHSFRTGATIDFIPQEVLEMLGTQKLNSNETSIYFQDEWKINQVVSTCIGGRFLYFQRGDYLKFEPRISVSYSLSDNLSLKGSFAVANQFLHLIIRNDITLPTDLWFPSSEKVKPSLSSQGILGVETTLGDGEYLITAEAYFKDMKNLYEYRDTAKFTFGMPLETDFTEGRGEAYGIELFINKRFGSFTGWLGYTLSWTKRFFDDLNNGRFFFPRYDRRHDLSLVLSYELSKSIEISGSWTYGTGQAYTVPTGQYKFITIGTGRDFSNNDYNSLTNIVQYDYSERNGARLPPFHKMDINFSYKYEWFKLPFELSFSIYNLYNNKNPFAWYVESLTDPASKITKKVVKQINLFPIIPSLGLNFKF